jgi:hypothetical protein
MNDAPVSGAPVSVNRHSPCLQPTQAPRELSSIRSARRGRRPTAWRGTRALYASWRGRQVCRGLCPQTGCSRTRRDHGLQSIEKVFRNQARAVEMLKYRLHDDQVELALDGGEGVVKILDYREFGLGLAAKGVACEMERETRDVRKHPLRRCCAAKRCATCDTWSRSRTRTREPGSPYRGGRRGHRRPTSDADPCGKRSRRFGRDWAPLASGLDVSRDQAMSALQSSVRAGDSWTAGCGSP